MPKNNRNGQAEIWTDEQLDEVMGDLSPSRGTASVAVTKCHKPESVDM